MWVQILQKLSVVDISRQRVNSFLASCEFCRPVHYSVGPDHDPNHLTLIVLLKEFSQKLIKKKVCRCQQKNENLPSHIMYHFI